MKCRILSMTGAGVVLLAGAHARGAYTGLSVELHTTITVSGELRDVFRVYANFDDPNNAVFWFGASGSDAPMALTNFGWDSAGSGFFNAPLGSSMAPTEYMINVSPATQWDSYFTIGAWVQDDAPGGQAGYLPYPVGLPGGNGPSDSQYSTIGSVLSIDVDSGVLPVTSTGGWNDATYGGGLKVGLMQLTVNAGEGIAGTLAVTWRPTTDPGAMTFTAPFQTFFVPATAPPAPGPLGLIVLAAARGHRRRA